jgi:hypothetical protein
VDEYLIKTARNRAAIVRTSLRLVIGHSPSLCPWHYRDVQMLHHRRQFDCEQHGKLAHRNAVLALTPAGHDPPRRAGKCSMRLVELITIVHKVLTAKAKLSTLDAPRFEPGLLARNNRKSSAR